MAEKKNGFWSKLFGARKSSGCCSTTEKSSGCCSTKTGENSKVAAAERAVTEEGKQGQPAPCCGAAKRPTRPSGGAPSGCC